MGPRQIIGLSPGFSRPIEIIFNPCACTGMMCFSAVACGSCRVPSMIGTFGPYTSASSNPTLWPSFTSASARLTATVVLPTPPLPLAMATRFFTPGMGWRSGICCGAPGGIWVPISHPAEMGSGVLAPLQRAEHKQDSQKWLSHSCAGAVAFFVFFAGAAGTWIVAADFRTGAHGLGRFGLRGAGLIL